MQACSVKILAKQTCVGPKKVFLFSPPLTPARIGASPWAIGLSPAISSSQSRITSAEFPHQESSFLMLVKAIFLVDSGCSFSSVFCWVLVVIA
jgi:hypothetical protein